jgi:predicted nucleic acid-binding protein
MKRFLYDTSIFVYALGGDHPYREPCREIVRRDAAGDLQGEASCDLLQELVHQRTRRTGDRAEAARPGANRSGRRGGRDDYSIGLIFVNGVSEPNVFSAK